MIGALTAVSFLKKIPYKWIAIGLVIAGFVGFILFQTFRINSLKSNLIKEKRNNVIVNEAYKQQSDTIEELYRQVEDYQNTIKELELKRSVIKKKTFDKRADLNKYGGGRLDKVAKVKPKIIEKKINESLTNLWNESNERKIE